MDPIRLSRTCPDEIFPELSSRADPEIREQLSRFSKTGPGEYGEGDRFRGIRVPVLRKTAKRYRKASRNTLMALLDSEFHEDRMLGVLIMLERFGREGPETRRQIYDIYMERIDSINNWDLIDISAPYIVGPMVRDGLEPQSLLDELAASESIWRRRIAVLATFHFIKNNEVDVFLRLARRLVNDPHDLMHKACGWMPRETAKRDGVIRLKEHTMSLKKTLGLRQPRHDTSFTGDTSMDQALEGIRIVDLSRVLAGPYCTMLLADLGAEVIKIERPDAGDDSRFFGPFVGKESLYFQGINRNKKSIELNLKDEKDKELLLDLVR